jgi:hypothetical protein
MNKTLIKYGEHLEEINEHYHCADYRIYFRVIGLLAVLSLYGLLSSVSALLEGKPITAHFVQVFFGIRQEIALLPNLCGGSAMLLVAGCWLRLIWIARKVYAINRRPLRSENRNKKKSPCLCGFRCDNPLYTPIKDITESAAPPGPMIATAGALRAR